MRLLVANLDCEAAFAEAAGVRHFPLAQAVARRIAALGTLMAAFGRHDDVLWTPLPVNPARLAGPQTVTLYSRAITRLPRPEAILAWGETREVAARRASHHRHEPDDELTAPGANWIDRLWTAPPDAEAAWRCNDRRFCVPIQEALGCRLPGAAIIDSLDALHSHLDRAALDLGPDQGWVLKAPFSASGRLRVRCYRRTIAPDIIIRIERLLARFGSLCFEPWMERLADFGCLGLIEDTSTWHILPPHRLETDRTGVFHGIAVDPDTPWLAPPERAAVTRAATEAARSLAQAGYRGPFGIDAFTFRTAAGTPGLQPICEINARLSFGFVAHALALRLGCARLRLRVDTGAPPAPPPETRIVPLLVPGSDDDTSAWLELPAA
jgi:hypothetical protein